MPCLLRLAPPSEVTSPPRVAVVDMTSVAVGEVTVGARRLNCTLAVPICTLSFVVSVAVKVTVSAVESVTVKLAMPELFVTADTGSPGLPAAPPAGVITALLVDGA